MGGTCCTTRDKTAEDGGGGLDLMNRVMGEGGKESARRAPMNEVQKSIYFIA
jgi:hypothetical protein